MRINGEGFDFHIDIKKIEFVDVTARYVPGLGALPMISVNGEEAWRGEFMGLEDAFKQARKVRDIIIHTTIKAGLYVNRNNGDQGRTS